MNVREAIAVMTVLLAWAPLAGAQANAPLKLEQTIPLPDVQGASIICLWMSRASGSLFRLWATTPWKSSISKQANAHTRSRG